MHGGRCIGDMMHIKVATLFGIPQMMEDARSGVVLFTTANADGPHHLQVDGVRVSVGLLTVPPDTALGEKFATFGAFY